MLDPTCRYFLYISQVTQVGIQNAKARIMKTATKQPHPELLSFLVVAIGEVRCKKILNELARGNVEVRIQEEHDYRVTASPEKVKPKSFRVGRDSYTSRPGFDTMPYREESSYPPRACILFFFWLTPSSCVDSSRNAERSIIASYAV